MQINDLNANPNNPRTITDEALRGLKKSLAKFGDLSGVVFNRKTGQLVGGHQRVKVFTDSNPEIIMIDENTGYFEFVGHRFSYREVDWTEAKEAQANLAANNLEIQGAWELNLLPLVIDLAKQEEGFEELKLGSLESLAISNTKSDENKEGNLLKKFIAPPFSILDAKQGYWVQRKAEWQALGIQSEIGREDKLVFGSSAQPQEVYQAKENYEKKNGEISWEEFFAKFPDMQKQHSTSIFDPVLCEICYKWFCPSSGSAILDPFAGGSVRGIVASKLGYQYIGIELRAEQVEANRGQTQELCTGNSPVWHIGDSNEVLENIIEDFDLVFSCPPYADLEVYSDDPKDLSTMEYPKFQKTYFEIIKKSVARLKENRFAVFVVGEVRAKNSFYYNFVGDTIKAFEQAGARYYNEIILATSLSSAPMRTRMFQSGRKVVKVHQNVLVFFKGDPQKIKETFGDVEILVNDQEED